jgi:hypothetical protein
VVAPQPRAAIAGGRGGQAASRVLGTRVTCPHLIPALPCAAAGPFPRPPRLVSVIPLSFPGLAGFIIPPEQSGRPVAEGR